MKVYVWILELAAVGVLILGVRWLRSYLAARKTRGSRATQAQLKQASRAERDRLDILALTKSMSDAAPAGQDTPSAGAAREARGRRAAAHSSFDPDLPAAAKDSKG